MGEFVYLTGGSHSFQKMQTQEQPNVATPQSNVPKYETLQNQLAEASRLLDDIVLKNYLTQLTELEVLPLDDSLKNISDIRLFKITEMVYQNNEYSTYKFASVFNALQNYNCGVFIVADSDGRKTEFYMGVRAMDQKRTTSSLNNTLKNALSGQFPGVKTKKLMDDEAQDLLDNIAARNIVSLSCVANNKDENFNDNEKFLQGLEKMALAMQDQRYTAIVLAKGTPTEQLLEVRRAYENIYTQLSPFANMQISYGTNQALSISDAFSQGTTSGTSHAVNTNEQQSVSDSNGTTENSSVSQQDKKAALLKGVGTGILGAAALITAPLTGGASLLAAGGIMAGAMALGSIVPKTTTTGTSSSQNHTESSSTSYGETDTTSESITENYTQTKGSTWGSSDNMQLTMQNKNLLDTLERIDLQLKRIDECESLGMWECAAYFLSDSQETAEMAASTYKALMRGESSGVETSAINLWGRNNNKNRELIGEYITNFIHPVFEYKTAKNVIPVSPASMVSSNELAIQMGLPRKSVCGFPVIEHADFGKEVVQYNPASNSNGFNIGNIFSMGQKTDMPVALNRDSLTMHTFITGSTGSGKSNTIYEILNQLRNLYNVPFLVVEPAKGEYKNIFGQFSDVTVYGTNPNKFANLLRLNPFRFPKDIHILEHLDRLVEIFNVCWPMYAAMPAVLKEAMEKAYMAAGWNLVTSENSKGEIYPNFVDLLEQIEIVINESKYSTDTKGDYVGALCTRVRSLTNGLNGLIFCNDDLSDPELFDRSVIVDLSRIGSTETKSLIMGLLVMKLNEYRMTSGKMNSPLAHITVLEEAHNLLKRTSTEQAAENSNLLGKSVEMLTNSIAEMRTYGEGFIIADQAPGLLDMAVIRNTNTKIILRLPEQSDRELVGLAAGLNKDQIQELAKLERGVAAVYQNDWVEPVLVQIDKCSIEEKLYKCNKVYQIVDIDDVRKQLLFFLIQGRVNEKLDFDVTEIERQLDLLNLSAAKRTFIKAQVAEYKQSARLELWEDNKFRQLSSLVADLLNSRGSVEKAVVMSADNNELSLALADIVQKNIKDASKEIQLALGQCMLKDFTISLNETEARERIYCSWIDEVKAGEVNIR